MKKSCATEKKPFYAVLDNLEYEGSTSRYVEQANVMPSDPTRSRLSRYLQISVILGRLIRYILRSKSWIVAQISSNELQGLYRRDTGLYDKEAQKRIHM